jgi:AAA family ATP:ADP antiporter
VPTLSLLVIFLTLRRAGNFALARPAREVLFTVVSREDKYKAKSFIDTFIYRAGDQIGAWSTPALGLVGIGMRGVSFVAAPLAVIWFFVSLWLGRKQAAMSHLPQQQRGAPLEDADDAPALAQAASGN